MTGEERMKDESFEEFWEQYNACPRCHHSAKIYASNAWHAGREAMRLKRNESGDQWRFAAVGAVEAELNAERERSQKLQAELDRLIKMQG